MKQYLLTHWGFDGLQLRDCPVPTPGTGEIRLDVRALSLNYRDLLVCKGLYNPRLRLPAVPISDAAGVVSAVGPNVTRVAVGDRVMTHFVAGWIDGPFEAEFPKTSLGTPGPGLAAEQVILPAEALLPIPRNLTFTEAATLPIAGLTAWSALVTEGGLDRAAVATSGHSRPPVVLTLGTGGVSIFSIQIAKALGATTILTSSSDAKLERAKNLGADICVNYRANPEWDKLVIEQTDGRGADITVETGGAGTLDASMRATRGGGLLAVLGALTGVRAEVTTALILMKRLRLAGVYVDSRAAFARFAAFVEQRGLRPVIDACFDFESLPRALRLMERGEHFGKIAIHVGHEAQSE